MFLRNIFTIATCSSFNSIFKHVNCVPSLFLIKASVNQSVLKRKLTWWVTALDGCSADTASLLQLGYSMPRCFLKYWPLCLPGVKISKNCQGSFGPLMSYFGGPSQSFKGPDFLISWMGLITVSLSPQSVNFDGRKQLCGPLARGPAFF